ncbi:hypothetical protein SAMN05444349_10999 [Bacteroides faecichinchillae]|uniref:Uncharacterized protein n=1 Tax=Bacteroides faecichinchillae TaxID=871325 RepID=A0A1M4Y350_9BACE|nr:hypothetical protein SAMN05444349_10999 [Bacteroides faecichinchillae]
MDIIKSMKKNDCEIKQGDENTFKSIYNTYLKKS